MVAKCLDDYLTGPFPLNVGFPRPFGRMAVLLGLRDFLGQLVPADRGYVFRRRLPPVARHFGGMLRALHRTEV